LVAGVAGLVAGAMSMAAGEYVSVHSQADTEQAELDLERTELKADDRGEHKELAAGSGLIRTPLTTLKMAVVAPMPSASVIRAIG
jgi:VIT1/CCC1 family predicted Fe2+/Mn2+ transporter